MTDVTVLIPEYKGAMSYSWQDHLHHTYGTKILDAHTIKQTVGTAKFNQLIIAIENANAYLWYLAGGRDNREYNIHVATGTKKEFVNLAEDALIELGQWFAVPNDQPDYFGEDSDKLLIWVAVLLQIQRLDILKELWNSISGDAKHPHNHPSSHIYQMLEYWLDIFQNEWTETEEEIRGSSNA